MARPALASVPRIRPRWAWAAVLVVVVAAVAVGAAAVRAYITPARAHDYAVRALKTWLRRDVRFAKADLTYWPPVGIQVEGLAVADPKGFQQGTMLTAKRVQLHLAGLELLFSRRLALSGVEIEEPSVRLWRGKDGKANWDGVGGLGDTMQAPSRIREFKIPGVKMTKARLGYFGADSKLAFFFQNLDLDATNRGSSWDWNLRVEHVGNPQPIPYLTAPIVAKGSVGVPKKGVAVPFKIQASSGDLSLSGSGAALGPRFELRNGKLTRKGSPAPVEDIRLLYVSDRQGSRIERLNARVGSTPFAASAVIEPPPLRGTFRGDLNLAEVSRFLPEAYRKTTGRAAVAVQFLAPSNDLRGLQLLGVADLANVSIPASSPESQPIQGVNGRVWFSALSAHTQDLQGRYGTLPFRVTARIDEPLALANALDPNAPANARVANVEFMLNTGPVDYDALFPPGRKIEHPPMLVASGVWRAPRLKARKLDVTDVIAKAHYDRGVVHLDGASAKAYTGDLTASGDFDFRAPDRPGYGIRVQGTKLDAPTVMSTWAPSLRNLLTGEFDVNLTMGGQGFGTKEALAHLNLDALARSADGRLAGAELLSRAAQWTGLVDLSHIQFKELLWHIIVKDGRVLFRDVTIHGGDGDYALAGWIGLNGDLGLTAALSIPSTKLGALTPQLRQAANLLTDSSGRVLLDFGIGGTIRDPVFSLKTDRVAEALVSRLQGQLLGQLMNPVEKALGDSLAKSEKQFGGLDVISQIQRQVLQNETQDKAQGLEQIAGGWLAGILNPKARAESTHVQPPPPPPPPPSDTAKAPPDTTKAPPAPVDSTKHP